MHYSLQKVLKLQALKIKKIKLNELEQELLFFCQPKRKTANCPDCEKRSSKIHQYQPKQKVGHIRINGYTSYLVLQKRRFYCEQCETVFTERITGLAHGARVSNGLKVQALSQLKDRSFSAASKQTKLSYHALRSYLEKAVEPFLLSWTKEENSSSKIVLGFDGVSFSGHDMLGVITNISNKSLKTILPDDNKQTVKKFFYKIPDKIKDKVAAVVIDMDKRFKNAIEETLPQARVIVDKFHLIQDANHRIDQERAALKELHHINLPRKIFFKNKEDLSQTERNKIKEYLLDYPSLRKYWIVKELLRNMYSHQDKKQAQKFLKTLIKKLASSWDRDLKAWARTLTYWEESILNYFELPYTNAYTEGVNNKLKLIKRISFGFKNKQIYIKKAMLSMLPLSLLLPHCCS